MFHEGAQKTADPNPPGHSRCGGPWFSLRGYSGAGLGGIVTRAELTKGALFHHFPDKRALAAAWIAERLGAGVRQLWVAPLDAADSLDDLLKLCRLRCRELTATDATSALVAIAAEVAGSGTPLGDAMENVFTEWRSAFAAVAGARQGRWLDSRVDQAGDRSRVVCRRIRRIHGLHQNLAETGNAERFHHRAGRLSGNTARPVGPPATAAPRESDRTARFPPGPREYPPPAGCPFRRNPPLRPGGEIRAALHHVSPPGRRRKREPHHAGSG